MSTSRPFTPGIPMSCAQLRTMLSSPLGPGGKLSFTGFDGKDVYNITAPFQSGMTTVIAGRVESRNLEYAEIAFFSQSGKHWAPIPDAPILHGLQDPCIAIIGGELIIGGVRFPVKRPDGSNGWHMEFYRGKTLHELKHFLSGPDNMKDIRFVELSDKRVGVFSRPQGIRGGRGRIGFTIAASMDAVSAELIANAPLLDQQCPEDEWVGANEIHLLENGLLGVLGHIACFDPNSENRHYYAMCFTLDPHTAQASPLCMIAERNFFPRGEAKRPDLADVIFSGGLLRHGDTTATLYAGLGDAEAGWVKIRDPFLP